MWDEDSPQEEPEYITAKHILPVVRWICGYLAIGLLVLPFAATAIYGGPTAGSGHNVDSGWGALGAYFGMLVIAMPIWFIGFPIAFFLLRMAFGPRGRNYPIAAIIVTHWMGGLQLEMIWRRLATFELDRTFNAW